MMGFRDIEEREVKLLTKLQEGIKKVETLLDDAEKDLEVDQEKLTIAGNHLEKGFTSLVKAITSKNLVLLPIADYPHTNEHGD